VKHYTYTSWTYRGRGRNNAADFSDTFPAIAFFDTEGSLELNDAIAALRVKFADEPRPFPARFRKCLWMWGDPKQEGETDEEHRKRDRRILWAAAPGARFHSPRQADPFSSVLVADIFDENSARMRMVEKELFGLCTEVEALLGQCPCPRSYSNGSRGESGPTACIETHLSTMVKDVVPLERLMSQYYDRRWRAMPDWFENESKLGEFEYISGRMLAPTVHFAPKHLALEDIHPHNIDDNRETILEMAKATAETRRKTLLWCQTCAFSNKDKKAKTGGACYRRAAARCSGTKTLEQVERAVRSDVEKTDPRGVPGFTWQQRELLMSLGNVVYDVQIPYFSSRKTQVRLGRFVHRSAYPKINETAFRVHAARSDHSRYVDYTSWDDLVAAIPELLEHKLPEVPFSEDVYIAYALMCQKRSVRLHRGRGYGGGAQRDLHAVRATAWGVDGYYGHAKGTMDYASNSLDANSSWTERFVFLHHEYAATSDHYFNPENDPWR